MQTQSSTPLEYLPAIVIGAGPIGLAAAAHLASRDIPFIILESEDEIAASLRGWAHVPMFTPWQYSIDPVAKDLLSSTEWNLDVDPEVCPIGGELRDGYLIPLSQNESIKPYLYTNHRVISVLRRGIGLTEHRRKHAPFEVICSNETEIVSFLGRAVLDCSGTWQQPNPLGASGKQASGEFECSDSIWSGIPDAETRDRVFFENHHTLVVGSGHSAMHAVRDLIELQKTAPATRVTWAIRRDNEGMRESCDDDTLTERALLRHDARELISTGQVDFLTGIRIDEIVRRDDGLGIITIDGREIRADRVVNCTGFRPDTGILREIRTDLHPAFECVFGISELVDPDRNACGTVPLHGVDHLLQPEPDFFILGSKSFGRAGTFLLYTGYEQVRSVVAYLDGDEAAFEILTELPESGLCSACDAWNTDHHSSCGCAGGDDADCCLDDAEAEHEALHA